MSATDGRVPKEAVLLPVGAQAQLPSTPALASPGVSLAATRVPTAPTTPDDPLTWLATIGQMANALFAAEPPMGGAPAAPPEGAAPRPPAEGLAPDPQLGAAAPAGRSPSAGAQPTAAPPAMSTAPLPPPHPFLSPVDVAPLFAPSALEHSFSVPLLNEEHGTTEALRPTPPSSISVPATWQTPVPSPRAERGDVFDAHALKREFPILQQHVHGKPLVWLDNAATTQKPQAVIDRLKTFYERENSNIHRAAHTLAARATDAYESARDTVRRFVNAGSVNDVVFVRGTTEGINLVAQTFGRKHVEAGDEIVVTHLEHHANIVPWQLLAKAVGAKLRVVPVDDRGQIQLDAYQALLNDKTKLVAMTHVSNALGSITPARQMISIAHERGIRVLLDGAQSVSHMRVDVQDLRPDFFVFSGHKIFGPTGIGVVVAAASLWDQLPPWQGGGNMIKDVTFEHTEFQAAPARFEAGTGNIADAVGLGAALEWVERVGIENIGRHEHALLEYGTERLLTVPGLRLVGTAVEKAGVLSFVVAGHQTQTLAMALDKEGIAVRGGHHCAQPILRRMGYESTVRASLAPYNTLEDIDALVEALCRLVA